MSDSSFTAHQPVYPQDKADAPSGDQAVQAPAVEAPPVASGIEIDGKNYTADQLREAIQGGLRQRDYTQKTQTLAEQRRALEEERELLAAQRAELERGMNREVQTGDDPFQSIAEENPMLARALSTLNQDLQVTKRHIEEQARERQQQSARAQLQADLEAGLNQLEGRPLFNRDQVRTFMIENDLRPNQVNTAYAALYGSELGRRVGEQEAMSRGATAAPYMGAGQTRVSPTFTGPHDLPGGPKIEGQSWEAIAKMALNDPEIPR